jgi:hypothetical protein
MEKELTVGDESPETRELIEVHVGELKLLFNPIDPSPLREKDLDQKAEEFIVSWARSARRDARLGLQVYVDRQGVADEAATVTDAIHQFFGQRALNASRRLSQLFRVGRTSLLIGVAFLAVVVTLATMVDTALAERPIGALVRESLLIGGWVAMWRPLEIFLYDWWPIRAERRLFERLSAMPVRITFKTGST